MRTTVKDKGIWRLVIENTARESRGEERNDGEKMTVTMAPYEYDNKRRTTIIISPSDAVDEASGRVLSIVQSTEWSIAVV